MAYSLLSASTTSSLSLIEACGVFSLCNKCIHTAAVTAVETFIICLTFACRLTYPDDKNDVYTPCVLNNNMCVYANHSNLLHCSTVQVIIETKYMIFVADIVVEIDYLSSFVAHIYHHFLIRCMYACSFNELNLLLYSSVMSP